MIIVSKKKHKAFTLAEAMLSIVILGIAASGVLLPFTSGATVRVEGQRRTIAANLAADLAEQIISEPFENIVPIYGTYSESQGSLQDAFGNPMADSTYNKFSRTATCQYVRVPQETDTGQYNFILINISVLYDGIELANIHRLISR